VKDTRWNDLGLSRSGDRAWPCRPAADFERASRIVEAYAHATGVQARGAVMFGDEMIDEASHKMAQAIVARGRASGLG
jgi:citrate lyase beta subunit